MTALKSKSRLTSFPDSQYVSRKSPSRFPSLRLAAFFDALEPRQLFSGDAAPPPPSITVSLDDALRLVPTSSATHVVVQSGPWSSPSTWLNNSLPTAGSSVHVPEDFVLTVDARYEEPLFWIRTDGTLTFDTTTDTKLTVETLVVTPTGLLEITQPAVADGDLMDDQPSNNSSFSSRIVFADSGPIDTLYDPLLLSRGLISFGEVSLHGPSVTGYVPVEPAAKGTSTLSLMAMPTGWKVGDRVILPGFDPNKTADDEERFITELSENSVTLNEPLSFNHISPDDRFDLLLVNPTRSVVLESMNVEQNSRRAHVYLSGSSDVMISSVGFYGLGRTDLRKEVQFPPALSSPEAESPSSDTFNTAGRHSVFIANRLDARTEVLESAFVDSPSYGLAIDSSNFDAHGNVAFDVLGAAFAVLDESSIGEMSGNLALVSQGSRKGTEHFKDQGVFGHGGHGFFLASPNVLLDGNLALSQRAAGFMFYLKDLTTAAAPLATFTDNLTIASGSGLEIHHHQPESLATLTRFRSLLNKTAISLPHSGNIAVDGALLIAGTPKIHGTGVAVNDSTTHLQISNSEISGFEVGLFASRRGQSSVSGSSFNNLLNIFLRSAKHDARSLDIADTVTFSTPADIGTRVPFNLYVDFSPLPSRPDDLHKTFENANLLGSVTVAGQNLYLAESANSFIPFASATAHPTVPAQFLDLTNQQLFDSFGLTTSGLLAPQDAAPLPGSNALVSSANATVAMQSRLLSPRFTNDASKYRLSYRDPTTGLRVTEKSTPLSAGWNVLTRTVSGQNTSFLVFADSSTPAFELDTGTSLRIHPDDLAKGIRVSGSITDDSFGAMPFKSRLKDLDKLPLLTAPDGSNYVEATITIRDRAKNSLLVTLTVVVDPNAPTTKSLPKNLKDRKISATLMSLLDSAAQTTNPITQSLLSQVPITG